MMQDFFLGEFSTEDARVFYGQMENFLSHGGVIDKYKWGCLRMKLPSFYVNFDRGIYRHTDYGRVHEDLALPKDKWNASFGVDFALLVPDDLQYWIVDGMNFWKLYGF
ncbi:hypothetical protein DZC75_07135 [Pseudomonas parafulva]|uniref:Uncharacterized protein n=2 Tax=Pseudomonas TaxID=286 RepID=A0AAI8PAV4_9PSED|nr:hypothetical protein [Pseudomonas parafulva]AXO87795.1 hypothetical protein DZC75_07135 [Pseudomonas parafulva]